MKKDKYKRKLEKISQKGFKGYPVATIVYYGPDSERATKTVVGIITGKDENIAHMGKYFSETIDIRMNSLINKQILNFLKKHHIQSVIIPEKIIGCPHEEGIDYPKGEKCTQCPFWANRNRWTGEILKE